MLNFLLLIREDEVQITLQIFGSIWNPSSFFFPSFLLSLRPLSAVWNVCDAAQVPFTVTQHPCPVRPARASWPQPSAHPNRKLLFERTFKSYPERSQPCPAHMAPLKKPLARPRSLLFTTLHQAFPQLFTGSQVFFYSGLIHF